MSRYFSRTLNWTFLSGHQASPSSPPCLPANPPHPISFFKELFKIRSELQMISILIFCLKKSPTIEKYVPFLRQWFVLESGVALVRLSAASGMLHLSSIFKISGTILLGIHFWPTQRHLTNVSLEFHWGVYRKLNIVLVWTWHTDKYVCREGIWAIPVTSQWFCTLKTHPRGCLLSHSRPAGGEQTAGAALPCGDCTGRRCCWAASPLTGSLTLDIPLPLPQSRNLAFPKCVLDIQVVK